MKNLKRSLRYLVYLLLCTILISQSAWGQISIPPAKGDRYSYFLNGDVWETNISHKSEFVLKVYSDGEYTGVWIQNLSMSKGRFIKLMNCVDSLDNIVVGGVTRSAPTGTEDWEICLFEVYGCADDAEYIPLNSPPDIFYLMKMIRVRWLNER
jgi:hypothetical protein